MELTQAQLDYLRTTRVHICTPCYGGMITESFFVSILKFMVAANSLQLGFTIDTLTNESLVTRARCSTAAKFLAYEPKSTHLMFIDADIGFEPVEIIKLLLANKDVVGGLYPKKTLPIQYVVNKIENSVTEGSLVTVANLGTGFMLIKRSVIEKMIQKYPDWHYQDKVGLDAMYDPFKYNLFQSVVDPDTKELLSEDYFFCKTWRDMGGEIWADLSIQLSHSGYYKFQGDATLLKPYL